MDLGRLTWPDVGHPLLLVPVGSCEQHGPHLPLDTDTIIAGSAARALARRLARREVEVLISPCVPIGASGEHAGFAGTLSVGAAVMEEVAIEVARSADVFGGVFFVNAHGGNSAALGAAVTRLTGEGRRAAHLRCSVPAGDAHAGRTETSLMLHLDSTSVRLDRVEAGRVEPWAELEREIRAGGLLAVTANGVLGDPTGASRHEGELAFAAMVERLEVELVSTVASWADE